MICILELPKINFSKILNFEFQILFCFLSLEWIFVLQSQSVLSAMCNFLINCFKFN